MGRNIEKVFSLIQNTRNLQSLLSESNIAILPSKDEENEIDSFVLIIDGNSRHRLYHIDDIATKFNINDNNDIINSIKEIGINDDEIIKVPTRTLSIIENFYLGKSLHKYNTEYTYLIVSSAVTRIVLIDQYKENYKDIPVETVD